MELAQWIKAPIDTSSICFGANNKSYQTPGLFSVKSLSNDLPRESDDESSKTTDSDKKNENTSDIEGHEVTFTFHIGDYQLISILELTNLEKYISAKKISTNTAEENKSRCVLKIKVKSSLTIDLIEKEIFMLKTISKAGKISFIVHFIDSFQTLGHGIIVLDNVSCISLQKHLCWDEYFDEYRSMFYTACIIMALHHLHSLNIAHGNLRLQSIVLNSDGYAKLMDLSFAEVVKDENYMDYFANDYANLGRCLFEMLTGDKLTAIPVKPGDRYLSKNSDGCKDFLEQVTSVNQLKTRFTKSNVSPDKDLACTFLSHAFFKPVNWPDLINKVMPSPDFSPIEVGQSKKLSAAWKEINNAPEEIKLIDEVDFQELDVVNCWKKKMV